MVMPRARKPHRCEYGTECTIQPGEQYELEEHPPWTEIQDDPDGGTSPLGHWSRLRYHTRCYGDMLYGTPAEHDAAVRADEADALAERRRELTT